MKAYRSAVRFGFKQISRDYMLIILLAAPFLTGISFRFFLPILDQFIANRFEINRILLPYYRVFDNILVFLTPSMICMIFSFLVLEERDDQVASYIFVTPVRYKGYVFARLIVPSILACMFSFLILMVFKLTKITVFLAVALSFLSTLYALAIALSVVSMANNKVEGLALTKLTGITFVGILAPYFIEGTTQYIFSILPSYWLGRVMLAQGIGNTVFLILAGTICSGTWIVLFYRIFKRKLK